MSRLAIVRQSDGVPAGTEQPPMPRSFLSVLDFTPEQLESCLALAAQLKRETVAGTSRVWPLGSSVSVRSDRARQPPRP